MASIHVPPSVADLVAQAGNYTYNAHIPLTSWLRTASTMQKEARVYEAEGNDAQTYFLLYRHADLVIQKLHTHSDRNKPENKRALNAATATVMRDLKRLEEIAPRINKKHNLFQDRRAAQPPAPTSLAGADAGPVSHMAGGPIVRNEGFRKRPYDSRPWLDAHAQESHSFAARLAQHEVQTRNFTRRNEKDHGILNGAPEARMAEVESSGRGDLHQPNGDGIDLSHELQEVMQLQKGGYETSHHTKQRDALELNTTYHYPSIPHRSAEVERIEADHSSASTSAPARPPKERAYELSVTALPPPIPPKFSLSQQSHLTQAPQPPPVPSKIVKDMPSSSLKAFDVRPHTPSAELDEFTFKPTAYLENGDPLRPVFLPSQLRQKFLSVASHNTQQNLETCGVLCGILKSNALFITRLVIPDQTSTSDTCETLNEGDLFDYCDREELMVLGWIHTHPTQTCFMSSRDLHTHVGYQVMMPESVAIVCAPTKTPSWGCFRLTDPPGKQAILNCSKPGIFHLHDTDNIYTEALKPGHVVELVNAPLELVDIRVEKKF